MAKRLNACSSARLIMPLNVTAASFMEPSTSTSQKNKDLNTPNLPLFTIHTTLLSFADELLLSSHT
jgi:hypothetical protein